MIIYPYSSRARSPKLLAEEMGADCTRNIPYEYAGLVINWGSSKGEFHPLSKVLNKPEAVAKAKNKIKTFEVLAEAGVPTVEWTTDPEKAKQWLEDNHIVFARTANQHGGKGIKIICPEDDFVKAKLYTKYVPTAIEYRMYVFRGLKGWVREKTPKEGILPRYFIRNKKNGWTFVKPRNEPPAELLETGRRAIAALGLDFGVVDALVDENKQIYILEVNTAPGLTEKNLVRFHKAISKLL